MDLGSLHKKCDFLTVSDFVTRVDRKATQAEGTETWGYRGNARRKAPFMAES